MRPMFCLLFSSVALLAQTMMTGGMPGPAGMPRYQQTYDEVKSALGLTEDQVGKLKQIQQDKMTATQAFYSKMADKQKELNALLESNSADPSKVGQLMLELQQLRKQPPPASDTHEKAVQILNAEQKTKLKKVEEAQKLRSAADQAMQLGLVNPPPPPAPGKGGVMVKPATGPTK